MVRVKEKMSRSVTFVRECDDLEAAHIAMETVGVHHVPVVRDGTVVGVLSDRDVLLYSHFQDRRLMVPKLRVGDVMSAPVVTCPLGATLRTAADQMVEHGIHCLPIVDTAGTLVGIITATDLLRVLADRGGRDLDEPLPFRFEQPSPLAPMFE